MSKIGSRPTNKMNRFFKQIWMILTLDCEGSAQLSSESLDRRLNWAERTAVWAHCMICKKSRELDGQLIQLGKKLDGMAPSQLKAESLSDDAKARILSNLQNGSQ